MAKRNVRQPRRGLFLIGLLTIAVFCGFSYNIWQTFSQVIEKNEEAKFLQVEMARLADEEVHLKNEVEKLNDPDYVARYARERFLYSKDGEFTIRLPGE